MIRDMATKPAANDKSQSCLALPSEMWLIVSGTTLQFGLLKLTQQARPNDYIGPLFEKLLGS